MEDGIEKFWSESHVSEDFDMSLRLQTAGFVVRLAAYGKPLPQDARKMLRLLIFYR
jgi:hypothetical protein